MDISRDAATTSCEQWQVSYNVDIGRSWGSMPLDLQKAWREKQCDLLMPIALSKKGTSVGIAAKQSSLLVNMNRSAMVAKQSSTREYAHAKLAIDGYASSDFEAGSCTHTKRERDPWWKLELPIATAVGEK